MTMNKTSIQSLCLLSAALIAGCAGSAYAQNALGDGTALDANTGQNGTRNYTRPNFAAELSFRNSIATGNAPGGLSFRGDLGYRAAGEFSGDLGSDSLFAFRRDSLYSGLAGMGIRGTDALQYQFALTTGSMPPQNLMGNMSLARDNYYNPSQYQGYGSTTGQRSQINTTLGYNTATEALDNRGNLLSASEPSFDSNSMRGMLRSSSTYTTTTNLQPSILSVYEQGVDLKPIGLVASPLLGVTSTPMAEDEELNPLVARPSNANTNPRDNNGLGAARLTTSYDALVDQMRERVEAMRQTTEEKTPSPIDMNETNDEWLVRQMQDLREKLYGNKPANENAPDESDSTNTTDPTNPESTDPTQSNMTPGLLKNDMDSPLNQAISDKINGVDPDDKKTASNLNPYDPNYMTIDPQTLEVLRRDGEERVQQLIDPRLADRDVYAQHIDAGQSLISEGRYFDAEERFTHALSIKPRDISAQLGRFHAQIGAGMVLSASVNLQTLFSTYPEIIASRYTGNLLPSEGRIESLIIRLKERAGIIVPELTTRASEGTRVQVSAAMLLAYLGYQTDDQATVQIGLDLVNEIGSEADRRFASLLGQIWLTKESSSPTGADSSDGTPID